MTLSMSQVGQLGGFLQVGPHYFPPRRSGAQIIMRGPHGQRLAADPVYLRGSNQPRGSGFRFWSEELNIPADMKWNPQQVVTGVMGLGSLGARDLYPTLRYGTEITTAISQAVPAARAPADFAASAMVTAIDYAARQDRNRSGSAFAASVGAINQVRSVGAMSLATLLDAERGNVANLMARHLARSPEDQVRYEVGTRGDETRAEGMSPEEAHALILQRERERRRHAGECVNWFSTPSECLESMQGAAFKTLLVGGAILIGAVVLYNFAGGVGRGLAAKAL